MIQEAEEMEKNREEIIRRLIFQLISYHWPLI